MSTILVTGAAGFIGSAFLREALKKDYGIVILDALTYAGHFENIEDLVDGSQCKFIEGDICNSEIVEKIFHNHDISGVLNFAAESHVDNSIFGPKAFIETNVIGTFTLLDQARKYWSELADKNRKSSFRFLQVSTDEVYGTLGDTGKFSEETPYAPNSPYSASKASSDHLVRAWHHTYGLPTITTNCSNNYGPRQFPEKLIPRMITCALSNEPLPVYGKGENVRDWIHVEDHARGVLLAFETGTPGETYCFGGDSERANIDVVKGICRILNELRPRRDGKSYETGIEFVTDRLGHDWRYAIDDTKAQKELGFTRQYSSFEEGLKQTIQWYLENNDWVTSVMRKKS